MGTQWNFDSEQEVWYFGDATTAQHYNWALHAGRFVAEQRAIQKICEAMGWKRDVTSTGSFRIEGHTVAYQWYPSSVEPPSDADLERHIGAWLEENVA